jgi:hypothetical protein
MDLISWISSYQLAGGQRVCLSARSECKRGRHPNLPRFEEVEAAVTDAGVARSFTPRLDAESRGLKHRATVNVSATKSSPACMLRIDLGILGIFSLKNWLCDAEERQT